MSDAVTFRPDDLRLVDDAQLLLRPLGTDADVDQTIKASLGHHLSYTRVLRSLSLAGDGAPILSVYLLGPGRSPDEHRAAPFVNDWG